MDDVARELLCSPSKISRIETGARCASLRDVRDLCRVYGIADTPTAAELEDLARPALERGWWKQYDWDLWKQYDWEQHDIADIITYLSLEQADTAITRYGMYWVHGLLQPEDYTRTIITGALPKIEPKALEQRVEHRMKRQELLDQSTPQRLRELLDEAVLHRQIGWSAVIRDQLDRIFLAQKGKVTMQVISFDVGAHTSRDSNFTYLEFAKSPLPNLRYIKGLACYLHQEISEDLARYREVFEYLRDAASADEWAQSIVASMQVQEEIQQLFCGVRTGHKDGSSLR